MVAATVALEDHAVESAEGAVANECANMIRKFVHEMRCRYASYGSAIHSYLPAHLKLVHQELEHALRIHSLLICIMIIFKNTLLGASISSVVPYQDVAVSPEEEVKPVGIRGGNHPLVDQGIWITHYYC